MIGATDPKDDSPRVVPVLSIIAVATILGIMQDKKAKSSSSDALLAKGKQALTTVTAR